MPRMVVSFSCAQGLEGSTDSVSPMRTLVQAGTSTPAVSAILVAGWPTIFALTAPFTMTVLPTLSMSSPCRKNAPRFWNSALTASYTPSRTITFCSVAQIMPLSNVLDCMMELTEFTTSAESSMMAGLLPGPTPRAGVPELYAALTMPGPPVARMMSASDMRVLVATRDGFSIQPTMPAGAPASTAASSTMRAASVVHFFARGCGLIMMALRVFRHSSVLKIAVEVGFVVGMTAATTPRGSAIFVMP